jgi:hypothetical protein
MQVTFTATKTINGNATEGGRDYEVHLDGAFWGWVSGPEKGRRVTGRCWVALAAEPGTKLAAPYTYWGEWRANREAAVLAAM